MINDDDDDDDKLKINVEKNKAKQNVIINLFTFCLFEHVTVM